MSDEAVLDLRRVSHSLGRIVDLHPRNSRPMRGKWVLADDQERYPGILMWREGLIDNIRIAVLWMRTSGTQLVLSVDDHPDLPTLPTASIAWWIWPSSNFVQDGDSEPDDTDVLHDIGISGDLMVVQRNMTLHRTIAELDRSCFGVLTAYFEAIQGWSDEEILNEENLPSELRDNPGYARQFFADLAERVKLAI